MLWISQTVRQACCSLELQLEKLNHECTPCMRTNFGFVCQTKPTLPSWISSHLSAVCHSLENARSWFCSQTVVSRAKIRYGEGEMMTCLLQMHESLDAQRTCTEPGLAVCTCNPRAGQIDRRMMDPWAYSPASLDQPWALQRRKVQWTHRITMEKNESWLLMSLRLLGMSYLRSKVMFLWTGRYYLRIQPLVTSRRRHSGLGTGDWKAKSLVFRK